MADLSRHTFDDRTDIEFAQACAEAAVRLAWEHPDWSAQEVARKAVESEAR